MLQHLFLLHLCNHTSALLNMVVIYSAVERETVLEWVKLPLSQLRARCVGPGCQLQPRAAYPAFCEQGPQPLLSSGENLLALQLWWPQDMFSLNSFRPEYNYLYFEWIHASFQFTCSSWLNDENKSFGKCRHFAF